MRRADKREAFGHIAELIKWKLSLAVAFSSVTGFFLSPSSDKSGLAAVATGVFLLSSGAAALNQYTERESDALMTRTMGRPLPSGKMKTQTALTVSFLFLISGSIILSLNGIAPLMLGLFNVLLYNVIYTGLKKITTLAIIPGAVVGAIPPFIGYTSAGGALTDKAILLFALFMFLWQVPHFWLLLLRYGHEYERAGIKTLYDTMDGRQIGRLVFLWVTVSSLLLWVLTDILLPLNIPAGLLLLGLNITFIIIFHRIIFRDRSNQGLKNAFILMNSFSLLIMLVIIATS
jgi:protoheme IX farnesyltransferase